MVCGVVAKFCPRKPLEPIPRTIVGKTAKVHCDGLVDGFRLPIGLWMKRRAHTKLDACLVKQVTPDVAGEDRIAVADDGVPEAVETDDVVEEGMRNR